jgi:hypothetical protein
MLYVTADGNKLPPYAILNRKTLPNENFCKDVIVGAEKNVWMTSNLMEEWLGCAWKHWSAALFKQQSMLVQRANEK